MTEMPKEDSLTVVVLREAGSEAFILLADSDLSGCHVSVTLQTMS